ncbi:Deoxyribodipyrimidine photo-lyase type I [Shewanella denitrificans OS217]|uniref:Deoxyribodipyrimidine photo-lyase n=1 Tax=Shewanella denitrificans (strain OS217 / ATCC BAA-1090 / DSM 15013) TaxID=318161 RepID=Q12KA9_SHEDO|nr:deoxyribodipyrimidine photo-lyase [Shewanella denitrificans]ABE56117.1 Deoxyribodipyrimidine photo-lyase type I [Shewanella denitrificans OS217]
MPIESNVLNNGALNPNSLMWFRNDLRLGDNPALNAACEYAGVHGGKVRAVYLVTPKQWQHHHVAPMQIDFIRRHLELLARSLGALGIPLDVLYGQVFDDTAALLVDYVNEHQIGAIFAGKEPEINEQRRDNALIASGLNLTLLQQDCLLAPGAVLNLSGDMYKVFTPFSKKWKQIAASMQILPVPVPAPVGSAITQIAPIVFDCPMRSSEAWQAGEGAAKRILERFLNQNVAEYQVLRDFPAEEGTSRLSPYLALGIISPKQCVAAILQRFPEALVDYTSPAKTWLNELMWREFYRHLLVAFPRLSMGHNFNALGDGIKWRNDKAEFNAWCEGRTGYPLVDAAMRQLNQTGWMHNRLRMLVASFLTKHLLIDWRWGEQYFRQQLIDGDLAANNGGWQWSAGTGCDAQPYFRVFSPLSQSAKFDSDCEFIKRFVPELSEVSNKAIHEIKCSAAYEAAKVDLFAPPELEGKSATYPAPIVEHSFARKRAIEVLSALKKG